MRFLAAFLLTCCVQGTRVPSKQEDAETELDAPSWDEWVAVAGETQSGVWDVQKIEFLLDGGDAVSPGWDGCEAFSSGYYQQGNRFHHDHAFGADEKYWGGRQDGNGKLWIGVRCRQSHMVRSVRVWDFGGHMSVGTTIWHNGEETNVHIENNAETTCAKKCLDLGFCCNDFNIGSNQLLSCAQACMIRARGESETECRRTHIIIGNIRGDAFHGLAYSEPTPTKCQVEIGGRAYSLCKTCKDLTDQCTFGVMGALPGLKGCSMDPPMEVVQPGWHFAPGGKSCTAACKAMGLQCTKEGLEQGNAEVSTETGIKNVASKLGHSCKSFDYFERHLPARPLLDEADVHESHCFLSVDKDKQIDCDAEPEVDTKHRFCMCVN